MPKNEDGTKDAEMPIPTEDGGTITTKAPPGNDASKCPAGSNPAKGKLSFFDSAHHFPKNPPINLSDYQKAVLDLAKFIECLGPIMYKGKEEMIRSANDMIEAYKKTKEGTKKSAQTLFIGDLLAGHKKSNRPNDPTPDHIVDLLSINRYLLLLSMVIESAIADHKGKKTPPNLAPYFKEAYDKIMKPHSSVFTNVTFNLVVNCAPSYKLFVQKLQNGSNITEAEVFQKLEVYSQQMMATNRHVSDLLTKAGYTV